MMTALLTVTPWICWVLAERYKYKTAVVQAMKSN
ncbi:hypothetical protein SAMN05518856_11914 [Paenibacillus sp. OK003]|nr:hypothetical protein SAMN05518856_11914 [Paenibacillus sp. OK003]